jgi:predicted HTH domain antitoxin
MQVTFDIPDTLADQLIAAGKDPARAALEALALEGYRTGQLYEEQVRRILGYESRFQVQALLKQHGIPLDYTIADFEQDMQTLNTLLSGKAAA